MIHSFFQTSTLNHHPKIRPTKNHQTCRNGVCYIFIQPNSRVSRPGDIAETAKFSRVTTDFAIADVLPATHQSDGFKILLMVQKS